MAPALSWITEPSVDEAADALALLAAVAMADGVAAVSEAVLLRLRYPDSARPSSAHGGPTQDGSIPEGSTGKGSVLHLLVYDSAGTLVGYAGLDRHAGRPAAEFAVHPEHRRQGVGGRMLDALLARISGPLWVWAHGEHPAALRLARRAGLERRRELWQLRRSLTDPVLPRPLPEGLRLRTFVPGQDEPAVVRVNNRAFAWHPEQGRWDIAELVLREQEPWFDPEGFFLAVDAEDRLRGFHWTKVHPDGLGEVYVVGVDPDAQGIGLGAALTTAGLEHLRKQGVVEVLLYVESDNDAALRTYGRQGFRRHHIDVEFLRADLGG